jgi:hypothetical protein
VRGGEGGGGHSRHPLELTLFWSGTYTHFSVRKESSPQPAPTHDEEGGVSGKKKVSLISGITKIKAPRMSIPGMSSSPNESLRYVLLIAEICARDWLTDGYC